MSQHRHLNQNWYYRHELLPILREDLDCMYSSYIPSLGCCRVLYHHRWLRRRLALMSCHHHRHVRHPSTRRSCSGLLEGARRNPSRFAATPDRKPQARARELRPPPHPAPRHHPTHRFC